MKINRTEDMSEDIFITNVHKQYRNKKIDYEVAEQLLYEVNNKSKRFLVFIALYDTTLKNDMFTATRVFREAYCASNNIYNQIKSSQFQFDLKLFLNHAKNQGVNFLNLMNKDEKVFYISLPDRFKIYRGLNNEEQENKNYGISWSLDEEEAKKYVYLGANNVDPGKGGIIDLEVEKKQILTVYSVHTSDGIKHEIIYLLN